MNDSSAVQRLLDLEAIKQLKARYFLYMDTKQWEAWRDLFTEDLVVEGTKQAPDATREQFVDGVRDSLAGVQACHHGRMPIIEFTGEHTARGVSAMFDDLRFPVGHAWSEGYPRRVGYGHYEEEYRREQAGWKISFMRLARLWVWREQTGPLVQGGVPSAGKQWLQDGRRGSLRARSAISTSGRAWRRHWSRSPASAFVSSTSRRPLRETSVFVSRSLRLLGGGSGVTPFSAAGFAANRAPGEAGSYLG
jgi:hypothetical protein